MKATWWLPWLVRWRAWRASRFGSDLMKALKLTPERRRMFINQEQHR
jgi:hypothetical protein